MKLNSDSFKINSLDKKFKNSLNSHRSLKSVTQNDSINEHYDQYYSSHKNNKMNTLKNSELQQIMSHINKPVGKQVRQKQIQRLSVNENIGNQLKQKEQIRVQQKFDIFKQEEINQRKLDQLEANLKKEKDLQEIQTANDILFQDQEKVRKIKQSLLHSEVLDIQQQQIQFKQQLNKRKQLISREFNQKVNNDAQKSLLNDIEKQKEYKLKVKENNANIKNQKQDFLNKKIKVLHEEKFQGEQNKLAAKEENQEKKEIDLANLEKGLRVLKDIQESEQLKKQKQEDLRQLELKEKQERDKFNQEKDQLQNLLQQQKEAKLKRQGILQDIVSSKFSNRAKEKRTTYFEGNNSGFFNKNYIQKEKDEQQYKIECQQNVNQYNQSIIDYKITQVNIKKENNEKIRQHWDSINSLQEIQNEKKQSFKLEQLRKVKEYY